MPLRRREPNCGSPTVRLHQTTGGESETLSNISNQDKWPVNKRDLVNKHIKHFNQFANSTDFEKL